MRGLNIFSLTKITHLGGCTQGTMRLSLEEIRAMMNAHPGFCSIPRFDKVLGWRVEVEE